MSGFQMVIIILTSVDPNHSKTGHYKIHYSDESGIRVSSMQMVTVVVSPIMLVFVLK